jgi:predicted AAA+ superfamily ATPase
MAMPQRDKSESPIIKNDGIHPYSNHLPRSKVVEKIYETARSNQHVAIGSSAGTGKTSLLQLLEKRLNEEEGPIEIIVIYMNRSRTADCLLAQLARHGINHEDRHEVRQVKNTWLLLDDAQNAYDRKFDPFWQFVVKVIASAGVQDNLFVVVAATYDLSTPESPADFHGLKHIDPNVTKEEATSLSSLTCTQNVGLRKLGGIP